MLSKTLMPEHTPSETAALRASITVLVIGLIAGRFDLGRISEGLETLDVRWFFAAAAILSTLPLLQIQPKTVRRNAKLLAICLSAWLLWLIVSTAWAPSGARVSDYVWDIFFLLVFLACAALTFSRLKTSDWEYLWKFIYIIAIVYFVGAAVAGPGDQGRYSAFGGGPNVFVRIMGLGAIAALAGYITTKKALYLLSMPIFVIGAILSGSRGGLAAAAIIAVIALPSTSRRLGKRVTITASLVLAVITAGLYAAFGSRISNLVSERVVQLTFVERYSSGRDQITDAAVNLFTNNPTRGVGLDGYYGLVGRNAGLEYPHNLFLAAGAEGGVVGLTLLAGAVISALWSLKGPRPINTQVLMLFFAGTFMLVCAMFSGDYYDSRFIWFFYIAAAAASTAMPGSTKPLHPYLKTVDSGRNTNRL